ncbi:Protein smg5 [Chamberlinius hualienensis]
MAKVNGPFKVENAENSAIAVQLYKTACDVVRMLDRATKSAANVRDLHQPKIISYRLRLREICERLMFVDPVLHGKKAEDFLWKKVHYDVIALAKKIHKSPGWTAGDSFWLQNHIRLGLGTYHHLIFRLQSEYVSSGGDSFTDFIMPLVSRGIVGQTASFKSANDNIDLSHDKTYKWALQAYQRFLICMGDLARYNQEFFNANPEIAARYYQQALLVCSESSMPFNQLGHLYTNYNYGFDTVYYYMRCTFYDNEFELARTNLNRAFERNRHFIDTTSSFQENQQPNEMYQIRLFMCKFIKYVDFIFKNSFEQRDSIIGELCENVLVDFQKCLELKVARPQLSNCCTPQSPCHLTDDFIFKMFVVAVMCVDKSQKQDNSNSLPATAFVLAAFSDLLNYIIICMQLSGVSVDQEEPSCDLTDLSEDQIHDNGVDAESQANDMQKVENHNDEKAIKPKKKKKIVRPRKKFGFDDSDLSEGGEDESVNEEFEGNETDDSESSVENDDDDRDSVRSVSDASSNSDPNDVFDDDNFSEPHKPDMPKEDFYFDNQKLTDYVKSSSYNPLELLRSMDQLLITVRICCNWLEAHPQIIKASAQGSRKLWTRFVTFINLLVQIISKLEANSEVSNSVIVSKIKDWDKNGWSQDYPLPEDLALKDLPNLTCSSSLKKLGPSSSWLSEVDQMLLRTACLRHCAINVAKTSEFGIQYVDESGKFISLHFETPSADETTEYNIKEGENQEHKQNLMQNMAQLWLEAEVKQLESSVQLMDRPRFSPYLIPDISVLLTHLDLIAQLMASKVFIFILPIVALQHLDEKKKDSGKARKAIRWLETEFQKHNRYLRAQKRHERVTLPLLKYPKRRDKDAWNTFAVLECAKYFSRYGSNDKSSSNCLATILVAANKSSTSDEHDTKSNGYSNNNLLPLARSSDLKVENIVEFFNNWKSNNKVGNAKKSFHQQKKERGRLVVK